MPELSERWEAAQREVASLGAKLKERKGARDQLLKNKKDEQDRLNEYRDEQRLAEQASLFLAAEIVERRQKAIHTIKSIGSSALRMIYGPDYKLAFETFDEKRDKGEKAGFKMELQIESMMKDKPLTTGLLGERGGGLIEVTAFGLRIAALDWMGWQGPLILDEAWKSMSADEKIDALASFLRYYIDATGRQIIFATHRADVFGKHADLILRVEKNEGVAKVSSINYQQVLDELAALSTVDVQFMQAGGETPFGIEVGNTSSLTTAELQQAVTDGRIPIDATKRAAKKKK